METKLLHEFSGEDPNSWISAMETYMYEIEMPEEIQIEFSLQYMVGSAKLWVQEYEQSISKMNWCDFVYHILWKFDKGTRASFANEGITDTDAITDVPSINLVEFMEEPSPESSTLGNIGSELILDAHGSKDSGGFIPIDYWYDDDLELVFSLQASHMVLSALVDLLAKIEVPITWSLHSIKVLAEFGDHVFSTRGDYVHSARLKVVSENALIKQPDNMVLLARFQSPLANLCYSYDNIGDSHWRTMAAVYYDTTIKPALSMNIRIVGNCFSSTYMGHDSKNCFSAQQSNIVYGYVELAYFHPLLLGSSVRKLHRLLLYEVTTEASNTVVGSFFERSLEICKKIRYTRSLGSSEWTPSGSHLSLVWEYLTAQWLWACYGRSDNIEFYLPWSKIYFDRTDASLASIRDSQISDSVISAIVDHILMQTSSVVRGQQYASMELEKDSYVGIAPVISKSASYLNFSSARLYCMGLWPHTVGTLKHTQWQIAWYVVMGFTALGNYPFIVVQKCTQSLTITTVLFKVNQQLNLIDVVRESDGHLCDVWWKMHSFQKYESVKWLYRTNLVSFTICSVSAGTGCYSLYGNYPSLKEETKVAQYKYFQEFTSSRIELECIKLLKVILGHFNVRHITLNGVQAQRQLWLPRNRLSRILIASGRRDITCCNHTAELFASISVLNLVHNQHILGQMLANSKAVPEVSSLLRTGGTDTTFGYDICLADSYRFCLLESCTTCVSAKCYSSKKPAGYVGFRDTAVFNSGLQSNGLPEDGNGYYILGNISWVKII